MGYVDSVAMEEMMMAMVENVPGIEKDKNQNPVDKWTTYEVKNKRLFPRCVGSIAYRIAVVSMRV
jgi:hypothetical protein